MKFGDTTLVREAAKIAGFRIFDRGYNDKRVNGRRIKFWIDMRKLGDLTKAEEILKTAFGERLIRVIMYTCTDNICRFPSIQVFLKNHQ